MKCCDDNSWYQNQLIKYDINIWVVELHRLTHSSNIYWDTLSADEKEKALSFETKQLQKNYVTARGTLRSLLGSYVNMPPLNIQFIYNKQGKPKIDSHDSVFFNLAHSKDLAIIAFSKIAEVGIDLEYMDSAVDFISLSKLVMTSEEQALFNSINEQQQAETFYTNWTRKEAFVKGLGLGLQFDLKNCSVGVNNLPELKIHTKSQITSNDWSLNDIHLEDKPYKAAVALRRNQIANYRTFYYQSKYEKQFH